MKRIRAFIIDDDTGLLNTLCDGLRMENWDVQSSSHGEAALEILKTQTFDIIVSDMNMPGINGLDILRETRQMNPEVIFVLMSGFADFSMWECFASGANEVLGKPFRFEELDSLVQRLQTPMWERWGNQGRELAQGRITNHVEVLKVPDDGRFSLGRGGVFLAPQKPHGFSRGDVVSFRLVSPKMSLEGIGKIRWKRQSSSSELPGMGIEFLFLEEHCRKIVIEAIQQSREVATIPAGIVKVPARSGRS